MWSNTEVGVTKIVVACTAGLAAVGCATSELAGAGGGGGGGGNGGGSGGGGGGKGGGKGDAVRVGKMMELILEVGGTTVCAAVDVCLVGGCLDPQEWCGRCWRGCRWTKKRGHFFLENI